MLKANRWMIAQSFIVVLITGHGQISNAKIENLYTSKPVLSLTAAKKAAAACEAVAVNLGLNLSIAIVDDGAHLLLFRRMSGASLASADIAIGKAVTASRTELNTRHLAEYVHGKNGGKSIAPGLAYLPGMVTLGGGLPIRVGQKMVGGIGVSGASVDQDEACAQAALNALLTEDKGKLNE